MKDALPDLKALLLNFKMPNLSRGLKLYLFLFLRLLASRTLSKLRNFIHTSQYLYKRYQSSSGTNECTLTLDSIKTKRAFGSIFNHQGSCVYYTFELPWDSHLRKHKIEIYYGNYVMLTFHQYDIPT
jgi:hypothetical protein